MTVVLAGPNRVLQCKTQAGKDGYNAVQLGFDDQKGAARDQAVLGHIKKLQRRCAVRRIKEFRNFSKEVKPGDVVGPTLFAPGDYVDAIGVTKGRGFEGVVKRHAFRRRRLTHGHKGWHRRSAPSASACSPARSCAACKMPGHMGQVRRTTQNLEIIQVREADNLLLIKGAIPGAKAITSSSANPRNVPRAGNRRSASRR